MVLLLKLWSKSSNNVKKYQLYLTRIVALALMTKGPFQTSNFACAESNANKKNLLFSLICMSIRFGTCKVRRLKRA